MAEKGRELLSQGKSSELSFRLATEGVQVNKKVARSEIDRVGELSSGMDIAFQNLWEDKFNTAYGAFNATADILKEKEDLRGFVDQVAPEAVSMMVTAYGKEWWKGIDAEDLIFVQDIAESNYRRDKLAENITDQLDWKEDGIPTLKSGHVDKLRLLHTVLAYDDAGSDSRMVLRYFAERMKYKNTASNPHVALDKMGVATDRVRKMFEWEGEATSEEGMNQELASIFGDVLNNANMLDDQGRAQVASKLGVGRDEDGHWSFNSIIPGTDGERAMHMVVNQRIRNKGIRENNQKLREVLKKDGPEKVELMKYGMDELVLDLFTQETALDCGRVFQERVRRVIIDERIKEIRSLDERRSLHTVASERIFQTITKVGAEIAYFVQDITKMMAEAGNSLLDRVSKGGFLEKVIGTASRGWQNVSEVAKDMTDDIPSDFPDLRRRRQRRGPLDMPDLFAEFEG